MQPAPIAFFAYKRPAHAHAALEALRRNDLADRCELFAFCDGPKSPSEDDRVRKTRDVVRAAQGFRRVTLVERERNQGLAASIIAGVGEVISREGRLVVVEEDMVTSPFFLRYMNGGLEAYAGDDRVACIGGYRYPVGRPMPETYFLRGADSEGWATWSRSWALFETDGAKLLAELMERGLQRTFDFEGTYSFTRMLKRQVAGDLDSWAIRWYASAFLAGKLTMYPGESLVNNIGWDGTGRHCPATREFEVPLSDRPIRVAGIEPSESAEARAIVRGYFRRSRQTPQALFKRAWWRMAASLRAEGK